MRTSWRTGHLFADQQKALVDPAFLDRMHFYSTGWEAPKLEPRLFTDHDGFFSDVLEEDFVATGNRGRDAYENLLTTVLESSPGGAAVTNAVMGFEQVNGLDVCRVDVTASREPAFVKNSKGDADLYVRINNSTRLLNTQDALQYAKKHWR